MIADGELSIAIATMRRWWSLQDMLPIYLEQPVVGEVVICDETGEDADAIQKSPWAGHPKLRILRNERRLGIYENKKKAMRAATKPWIAVLDSDNVFPEDWFATIAECISSCPASSKKIFASADFRTIDLDTGYMNTPCSEFSGISLTQTNWNQIFNPKDKRPWHKLVNDGNWVIPREAAYLLSDRVSSEQLQACDAIYMAREWVLKGYEIVYVPGLVYTHTVHLQSSWLLSEKQSTAIMRDTDWQV